MDPIPGFDDAHKTRLQDATDQSRSARSTSLHALQVVEYALSAPAPYRQRTWLHRVAIAVDALAAALDHQIHDEDDSIGILSEIALSEPGYAPPILRLRQEQQDLRIAVASLREQIDDHLELPIDTVSIRDRFATVAHRYRQHRAREADLVYSALGIDITGAANEL